MELKKENQLLTLRLFLSSEWVLGVVTIQSLKKIAENKMESGKYYFCIYDI